MEIERFEYHSEGAETATVMGLNIQRKYGITHANLFALDENKGEPISKNLWKIASEIAKNVLMNERIDSVNWTLTSGRQTTNLHFSSFDGKPFKLDISNNHALNMEEYGHSNCSLARYITDFEGQPPTYVAEGRTRERTRDPLPKTVFCVPCDNPKATDGVFHCQPAYYDADHMRDNYEFILVDTKKVIKALEQDDPGMLNHAARKMSGDTAEEWLESTSMEHPRDMGMWGYRDQKLGFYSGQAALIKVAEDLDLPYFPIAVEKAIGEELINSLRARVGYSQGFLDQRQPSMHPVFNAD